MALVRPPIPAQLGQEATGRMLYIPSWRSVIGKKGVRVPRWEQEQ